MGLALGASTLTHPVVWFVIPALIPPSRDYYDYVIVAESFAVGAEALYLHFLGVERPFEWSLGTNALSVAVGFALYYLDVL